eukprot:jgi/Ulvmu1/7112/UM034_0018.1
MLSTLRQAYRNVTLSSHLAYIREPSLLLVRGLSTTDDSSEDSPAQGTPDAVGSSPGSALEDSQSKPATESQETPTTDTREASSGSFPSGSSQGKGDPLENLQDPLRRLEWGDFLNFWSAAHHMYIQHDRDIIAEARRRQDRDGTHKLYAPDGSVEAAYDDTSRPLYDTRVWLHMYEGPGGQLTPSFCRRTGGAQYMYDFTGFAEWRVEQNALLSDDAKCLMYRLWAADRTVWPEETLASVFKIRVQRALAIVKIKEREFQHAEQQTENLNRLQRLLELQPHPTVDTLRKPDTLHTPKHLTAWFDQWLQVYELLPYMIHPKSAEEAAAATASGTDDGVEEAEDDGDADGGAEEEGAAEEAGEKTEGAEGREGEKGGLDAAEEDADANDRRVKLTPAQVKEVMQLHNELAAAANTEARQIATHADLWRTVYARGTAEKYIPFLQTMPNFQELPAAAAAAAEGNEYDAAVAEATRLMDASEIAEFKRNLSWALQETGQSIQREPRKRGERGNTLPRKPEAGWPILVTPLHAAGRRGTSFVARPDGSRRELSDDEALYLKHFKREPKIFSRPRSHAPYTNETLHMFTQNKPNPRHDLYNPPYRGSPKPRHTDPRPDNRTSRQQRMAANRRRRELDKRLALMRM